MRKKREKRSVMASTFLIIVLCSGDDLVVVVRISPFIKWKSVATVSFVTIGSIVEFVC